MSDLEIREDNADQFESQTKSAVERALEKIGLVAEGYAVKLCPVDTGRLRSSITHVIDSGEAAVYIGTNVEYAPYQELGTSRRDAANGGRGFLRPAATDHADTYRSILKSELQG